MLLLSAAEARNGGGCCSRDDDDDDDDAVIAPTAAQALAEPSGLNAVVHDRLLPSSNSRTSTITGRKLHDDGGDGTDDDEADFARGDQSYSKSALRTV